MSRRTGLCSMIAIAALAWVAGWLSHGWAEKDSFLQISGAPESAITGDRSESLSGRVMPVEKQSFPAVREDAHNSGQVFQQMLVEGRIPAAMAAWPRENHQAARDNILSRVRNLRALGRGGMAIAWLKAYRKKFPEDVETGLLHADLLHALGRFREESLLLYDVLPKTAEVGLIDQIRDRLKDSVQAYAGKMRKAQNYRALLAHIQRLNSLDGGNQTYALIQADTLIQMGLLQQAESILRPLTYDPAASRQAESLIGRIGRIRNARYQVSIPLRRIGEHYLVPVSINGQATLQLMLDTGASITLIDAKYGKLAGVGLGRKISLQTANGAIHVPVVPVKELVLGGFRLHGVDIGLMTESGLGEADGLLGMNVLKHFNFHIDQRTEVLKISLRSQVDFGR